MMEGVSSEAASLAGTQGLGKLIYLYDDNKMTIEGHTDLAFSEDVAERFDAYGWQVLRVNDGNDVEAIAKVLTEAKAETECPSLVMVRTILGCGSPVADNPVAHGAPLGAEAVRMTKMRQGMPGDRDFYVPPEVQERFREVRERGEREEATWRDVFAAYQRDWPEEAGEWERRMGGIRPRDWEKRLPVFPAGDRMATRSASGTVLNALSGVLPELVGGSADLAPSNDTLLKGKGALSREEPDGRNIHFGVREHAMAAFLNGIALHGGFHPYGGTFLVFSDYMKPSIRLAALMETPVTFVFTHDSIGLGEDGPTHQPVEQLAALRAVPGLVVFRPADAVETAAGWKVALERREGPLALVLSRQKLPVLGPEAAEAIRGAYVLAEAEGGTAHLILIATGSEVSLALEARKALTAEGIPTRVVSMPSWELFSAQDAAYRETVLPAAVRARVSIEAGSTLGWERYVGSDGVVIGLDHFGASAPAEILFREFGFTVENVVEKAKELLDR